EPKARPENRGKPGSREPHPKPRTRNGELRSENREPQAAGGTSGAQPSALSPQPSEAYLAHLGHELLQIEQRMIPAGLHVFGKAPLPVEQVDFLALAATFRPAKTAKGASVSLPAVVAAGLGHDYAAIRERLAGDAAAQSAYQQVDITIREAMRHFVESGPSAADIYLAQVAGVRPGTLAPVWTQMMELLTGLTGEGELAGVLRGLRGGFIPPSPANDVVRDPAVLPTGRNVYSLDPYRVPSQAAMERGQALARELLASAQTPPQSVAVVLWGSDNLKSECEGVAQVLALLGARPISDELGSVSDVELVPLEELGRPRIDVVVTVSGIFRDLLGNQIALIDRAARLAAGADEEPEQNYVRRNALEQAAALGVSVEEAAVRVFANAPGSYGANVNHMVESGTWDEEEQLSDAFLSRKSFTLGAGGIWRDSRALMEQALAKVDLTFQNIDSFEVGLSDIDNYYESLGGLTKSVELLRGERPPVLVADAVAPTNRVSSLEQAVRLETRAKLLNPKWYEAMLAHGYEGAREIEARVNNTYGWSATAGAVESWVYQGVAETYMLDDAMRQRLADLNPHAAVGVVRRLLEANGRGHWDADEATLEQLRVIYADLEDRLEGVMVGS
ncbi:MAG: magnesium chelatase subunit H, partial [Oscillochloris sp.]|nr:magnesium chelatase subunit H [Oscillochloris sp.]